jgi:hypothetical protein
MKKFNWGHGLVLSFILFAIGTFVMVYIAMTTKVDLVTDDYYEKELRYQQQIDIMNNSNDLDEKISISFSDDTIMVRYPKIGDWNSYRGTVSLFRPSDKSKDSTIVVALDSSFRQSIHSAALAAGLWRMKIAWSVDGKEYYHEQPLMIQ